MQDTIWCRLIPTRLSHGKNCTLSCLRNMATGFDLMLTIATGLGEKNEREATAVRARTPMSMPSIPILLVWQKRAEDQVAFFGAVDSRAHLYLSVVSLLSVQRFHPEAGYFMLVPGERAAARAAAERGRGATR